MARPPKAPEERPVLVFHAEVRVYPWEPELLAYFGQFKPGQYATAIKRAVRASLLGGETGLLHCLALSQPADEDDCEDNLDDFVG